MIAVSPTTLSQATRALPTLEAGALMRRGNLGQRILAKATHITEDAGKGLSTQKFMQDTLSVWAPKALFTRSLAEFSEMSFLEFVESAFFYYSPGILGKNVFQHAARKLNPGKVAPELISKSYGELVAKHGDKLNHVLPVKAATILAAVGTAGIFGEYSLSFAKNLLTETVFKKSRFSDIVGLSDGQKDSHELSPQGKKAVRRIGQTLGVLGGVLAGSALLARYGHASPALVKASEKLVKNFDFNFKNVLNRHGKPDIAFDLGRKQLWSIIGLGVVSYLDAARDGLERKEVATRLAIVAPWLAVGDQVVKSPFINRLKKSAPELFETIKHDVVLSLKDVQKAAQSKGIKANVHVDHLNAKAQVELKKLKTLTTLEQDAWRQAVAKLGATAPREQLEAEAFKLFQPLYNKRLSASWTPFAIGSLGVSGSVALLNRIWTRIRYENSLKDQINSQPGPQSVTQPFTSQLPTSDGVGNVIRGSASTAAGGVTLLAAPSVWRNGGSRAANPFASSVATLERGLVREVADSDVSAAVVRSVGKPGIPTNIPFTFDVPTIHHTVSAIV